MMESMIAKQEISNRRQWVQQMNLQRKQRQQLEYKALLAEKLSYKEQKKDHLHARK